MSQADSHPSGASQDEPRDAGNIAEQVIAIVRTLAIELQPRNHRTEVTLDTELDRGLGFDSLSRAELLLRLDREFQANLPESLLAEAETPRDLVNALLTRKHTPGTKAGPVVLHEQQSVAEPDAARTLIDVLDFHTVRHADRLHLLLRDRDAQDQTITYGSLSEAAGAVAAGLLDAGCVQGDRVAIMLPTGPEFFQGFLGILMAGCVPVPVYPPLRLSQIEDHLQRQAGILNNAQVVALITDKQIRPVAVMLGGLVDSLKNVATVGTLSTRGRLEQTPSVAADQTALIQYTSGSTGNPKGVVLSHANLLANIRAMGTAARVSSNDVFVSWLPLYHDMGLIGAWLGSLYYGCAANILSPLTFLADPSEWLRAMDRHRATVSASPNFGFELCTRRIRDEDIAGIDLSSLRMIVNGAEPVAPGTVRDFSRRFGKFGLPPSAVTPVYGLAEASVGLAFPPPGRLPVFDRIDREAMSQSSEARPAAPDDSSALEFAGCGSALPGHEVRIVDEAGRELPDRKQGRLEFRGPSTTSGYFRDPAGSEALIRGDWLDSGDLAYVVNGEIFVTGRIKDIIIRAGRNIYPHELEERVGNLQDVRKGCVAVFPSIDRDSGTERLIIVAETRQTGTLERDAIHAAIVDATLEVLELPPDDIVLASPGAVPKTSSGKIRRAAARKLYEADALTASRRALWWQLLRLSFASVTGRGVQMFRRLGNGLYAAYWWCLLCTLAAIAWPGVMLIPSRPLRHRFLHRTTRLFLSLSGVSLVVSGLPNVPERDAVIVSNHASYLDSLVIMAALKGPLTFVAKQELEAQWIAGPFLKRIGCIFVRRDDRKGGLADAGHGTDAARRGERLVWFAEGTLTRRPGLADFHLGPFVAAAEANVPVLPVVIVGTRQVLRGEQWYPRRRPIELHIGQLLEPEGEKFAAALDLRDRARNTILDHCGEPDLSTRQASESPA